MRRFPTRPNGFTVLWDRKRQQFRMSVHGIFAVTIFGAVTIIFLIKHWS